MSRSRVAVVTMVLIVAALTIVVFGEPVMLLVRARVDASINCTGIVEGGASSVHYVYEDRIFDENGREVIWRGAGCSYSFNTDDYKTAWQAHLPEIQAMGLNTMRLAFRFAFDTAGTAEVLDYSKLDWVLDFLAQNNIKAILDNHGGMGFGSQALLDAWTHLASRYRGDSRIVAYELFNEPYGGTGDAWIKTKEDVALAYANLTKEIREVDPYHIHIWQTPHYLPPLEEITEYLQPNTVFTVHRWWTNRRLEFDIWTPEQLSNMTLGYIVEMREKLKVPFWLGEFGCHGTYGPSNPEWVLTEKHLWRCEEQAVGWNLWMSAVSKDKPWNHYLAFFPLQVYNPNLVRQPWQSPSVTIKDYVIDQHGVDLFELYRIEMRDNNDFVELKPGILVLVVDYFRLDNSLQIVGEEEIQVTETLRIINHQFTAEYPGNWDTVIYALSFNS